MGYFAEKKIAEHEYKRAKRIALIIVAVIVVALCIFSSFVPPNTWKYYFDLPKIDERNVSEMRVHFVDVGQGDAIIVELPDDKIVLIDGGSERTSASNALMRYLNALKIDTIDILIATHTDADHCGGLDTVVKHKNIGRALLPVDDYTNNTQYASLYGALRQKGVSIELTSHGEVIEDASYTLACLYPYDYTQAQDQNELSAVIWLDFEGTSFIFTGDASTDIEEKLMRDDRLGAFDGLGVKLEETEILKVSHHGSNDATATAWVEYLGVETAVISCGLGNAYNHPGAQLLERLKDTAIYRTDQKGSVVVSAKSNGEYTVQTLGK